MVAKSIKTDILLIDLLNKPEDFNVVASRLEHLIWSSFVILDPQINPGAKVKITRREVKRRFDICIKWFRIMRMELGWGQHRSLDVLPWVLANEIIGIDFTLEELRRHGWTPDAFRIDAAVSSQK
jgi:hypothetical protein